MNKPSRQRWKLKDLRDSAEEVRINEWSLDTPATQYTATAAHYGHHGGVAVMHFAQMLGSRPMNALAVALPPESISEILLPSLGNIRERLERLRTEGKIAPVPPLDLEKLEGLGEATNYLQKAADRARVASGDNFASLDFFKLPMLPQALIEARPNEDLEIEDVVRVIMSTSLFDALVKQMDAVEAYEPEAEQNEGHSE